MTEKSKKYAFQEYQLFYESTEKVTDRRNSANRWNYSICSAIIIGIIAIINWGLLNISFLMITFLIIIILCILAILFCTLWIRQIFDYKELNNAKFQVLNEMAPYLTFSEDNNDERKSYKPFIKEWEILKKAKATTQLKSSKLIALKSTNTEFLIPAAFRIIFILIIFIIISLWCFNFETILTSSIFKI